MTAVTGTTESEPGDIPQLEFARVRVWDGVVRSTHWLIAVSILILSITGIFIGYPFGGGISMTTVKVVHFYTAIVFTLSVGVRILWMFTGTLHARWRNFVPVDSDRAKGVGTVLSYYLCLRVYPPFFVGHNPLAGLSYLIVFFFYLLMIVTGWGLYGVGAHVESPFRRFDEFLPWFGGPQSARWFHHVGTWFLIWFAIHHVYSAVLFSVVEKNGIIESIFSGYKWFPRVNLER
jgi:Ni/Fe-hydrogenase 1 B-type cytochrome subunit